MQHQQEGQENADLFHAGKAAEKFLCARCGHIREKVSPPINCHGVAASAVDAPQKALTDLMPPGGDTPFGAAPAAAFPCHGAIPEGRQQVFPADDPVGDTAPIGDMFIHRGIAGAFGRRAFVDNGTVLLFAQKVIALLPDPPQMRPLFAVKMILVGKGCGVPAAAEMHFACPIQPQKDRTAIPEADQ